MRIPFSLCIYCEIKYALRSSLRWAKVTYKGLPSSILPFISVTARVASSAEEKQKSEQREDEKKEQDATKEKEQESSTQEKE